jgi:riboflavin kinase / FMN adenylyltransferase
MEFSNHPILLLKKVGPSPVRLALGNFDGVHVGHRRLIAGLVSRAKAHGDSTIVMTFNPHPAQFFGRVSDFKKIDTQLIQRRILAEQGVTGLLELNFDAAVAAMTAQEFLREVIDHLPLKEVCVGRDFRFGRERGGDVHLLSEHGKLHGFDVSLMEIVRVNGDVASSSSVRLRLIQNGAVEDAAKILGRSFCLMGRVVQGDRIGHTLGFPTANIGDIQQLIPKNGVYAGRLKIMGEPPIESSEDPWLPCVINIGVRPTIKDGLADRRVEAHVYDSKGRQLDIYDQMVEIEFLRRLRDEMRFDGLEALKAQIGRDIAEARR